MIIRFNKVIISKIIVLTIISIIILNLNASTIEARKSLSINSINEESENFAVIVACTDYKNSEYNIPIKPFKPIPERKLRCLYDSLIQSSNWDEENIILLLNEKADKKNITDALDEMSNIVGPEDYFLFSWQGHGSEVVENISDGPLDEEDGKDEIICPYDISKNEKNNFVNYITDDELNDYFNQINSLGMCLIFDCCLSGGMVDSNESVDKQEIFRLNLAQDFKYNSIKNSDVNCENRVIIMSTLAGFVGRATYLTGFPLTRALSFAFNGYANDENNDGYISAEEAFIWAKPRSIAQSTLYWSFVMGLNYITYLIGPARHPFIRSFLKMVISYILTQKIVKSKSSHLLMNYPNMQDDYDGDLCLVKI